MNRHDKSKESIRLRPKNVAESTNHFQNEIPIEWIPVQRHKQKASEIFTHITQGLITTQC